ncbi:hypothetical protein QL285_007348 [Trifolium repens]|nr:hypothetical protein QL285_007348 [Trifolium repens]
MEPQRVILIVTVTVFLLFSLGVLASLTGFVGGGGVGSGTLVSLSTLVYTPHRKLLPDSEICLFLNIESLCVF